MKWYIKSAQLGYYVGHCLGFGFFESHITDGTLSPKEQPVEFESREEAQAFLDSWTGGSADCFVTDVQPIGVFSGN
jgi:hypothetical protein